MIRKNHEKSSFFGKCPLIYPKIGGVPCGLRTILSFFRQNHIWLRVKNTFLVSNFEDLLYLGISIILKAPFVRDLSPKHRRLGICCVRWEFHSEILILLRWSIL
jgi:hypothetical protein